MKNKFSLSIDESLTGRTTSEKPTTISENTESNPVVIFDKILDVVDLKTDNKGKQDKGLGRNLDGSFKQSNAGRREIPEAEKKVQLPLTLMPTTKETLDNWASKKPRSAANYVSEYVEEHLKEIMDYFSK